MMGEWSSAGNMLQLNAGAPWFAAMPQEAWPDIEVHNLLHSLPLCGQALRMVCKTGQCAGVKGGKDQGLGGGRGGRRA